MGEAEAPSPAAARVSVGPEGVARASPNPLSLAVRRDGATGATSTCTARLATPPRVTTSSPTPAATSQGTCATMRPLLTDESGAASPAMVTCTGGSPNEVGQGVAVAPIAADGPR